MSSRSAFHGSARKLVLAFDVGMTYSGISYRYATLQIVADRRYILDTSVLDPGVTPDIKAVTRYVELSLKSATHLEHLAGFRHMNISLEPLRSRLLFIMIVLGTSRP